MHSFQPLDSGVQSFMSKQDFGHTFKYYLERPVLKDNNIFISQTFAI
jgi:hypothetical protein